MPYALNDVIKIELHQTYLDKDMINSLFYKIVQIVSGAIVDAVLELLIEYLVDSIITIQSEDVLHVGQTIYNMTDDVTTTDFSYIEPGEGVSPENFPSYVAVGWKKAVATRITRPGSVRIGGIEEGQSTGNTLNAAYETLRSNLAASLGLPKQVDDAGGNVVDFSPVVVGRLEAPPDSGKYVYDLTRVNFVTGLVLPRMTTQNSRKATI